MVRELLSEVYRRDKVLAVTGWLHIALFSLMLCAALFDHRIVMGLNPWIKPMKFAVSITLYVWTVAWFFKYLPGQRGALAVIRWGISAAMLTEIVCIGLQAGRGTTSHYNTATGFDSAVFGLMGGMILLNTLLVALLLALFFIEKADLPLTYLWGIRLGLLFLLLGSADGVVMILHGAHSVGLPDGGPGLPLVNWSTRAGDLRIAHLLGLHGLQILPLASYGLTRWGEPVAPARRLSLVFAFALTYAAVTVYLFWQAIQGRTLIPK